MALVVHVYCFCPSMHEEDHKLQEFMFVFSCTCVLSLFPGSISRTSYKSACVALVVHVYCFCSQYPCEGQATRVCAWLCLYMCIVFVSSIHVKDKLLECMLGFGCTCVLFLFLVSI